MLIKCCVVIMEPDKKSSSKWKKQTQRTLAAFGFTKTVIHQNKEVKIAIPEFAPDPETATCSFCNKKFKSVQGYAVYTCKMCSRRSQP